MTCIAAIAKDGRVFMGADSASIEDDGRVRVVTNRKVFLNNGCVIGSAGNWRQIEILSRMDVPDPYVNYDEDTADLYVSDEFVPASRVALAADECNPLLVGVHGRLFLVDTDYHVEEQACGYSAVGVGAPWAQGSLFVDSGAAPEVRIELALSAAEFSCSAVRGPFHIEVA